MAHPRPAGVDRRGARRPPRAVRLGIQGLTNVVRHAQASRCAVTDGRDRRDPPTSVRTARACGACASEGSADGRASRRGGWRLRVGCAGAGGRGVPGVTIRVLLAEDQGMMRGALALLLDLEDDIEVVAQVGRATRWSRPRAVAPPDVALLDIEMPGLTGLDAAARLRTGGRRACQVLILTTFGRPGLPAPGDGRRARGFLVKDGPVEELAAAIRRVLAGQTRDRPGAGGRRAGGRPEPAHRARARRAGQRRRRRDRSPTSPPACTCRRAPCATTCPPRSARPAPATASRRCGTPTTAGGCDGAPPARLSRCVARSCRSAGGPARARSSRLWPRTPRPPRRRGRPP